MSDVAPSTKQRFIIAVLFVLLFVAIGTPFYGNFFNKDSVSEIVTSLTVNTEKYTKILPWNRMLKSGKGGHSFTSALNCTAKSKATRLDPHIVSVKFFKGEETFSKDYQFTEKKYSTALPINTKATSTNYGSIEVTTTDPEIDCYTTIYKDDRKNIQSFYNSANTESYINFNPTSDTIDAVLFIQNLTKTEADLVIEKIGSDGEVTPLPDNKLPSLGILTVSVPYDEAATYRIEATSSKAEIRFISYVEYQTEEDLNNTTYKKPSVIRRYAEGRKKVTLPFNLTKNYINNLSCTAPKNESINATFRGKGGVTYSADYLVVSQFTKSLRGDASIIDALGKVEGELDLKVPYDTSCYIKLSYGDQLGTDFVSFYGDEISNSRSYFVQEIEGGTEGRLLVYNLSADEANLKLHRFTENGELLQDNSVEITLPPYGMKKVTLNDINEKRTYHLYSDSSDSKILGYIRYKDSDGAVRTLFPLKTFITSKSLPSNSRVVMTNTGPHPARVDYLAYGEDGEAVAGGSHYVAGYAQRTFDFGDVLGSDATSVVIQPYFNTFYPIECDAFDNCTPARSLQLIGTSNGEALKGVSDDPNDEKNEPLLFPIFEKEEVPVTTPGGDDTVDEPEIMEQQELAALPTNTMTRYIYPPKFVPYNFAKESGLLLLTDNTVMKGDNTYSQYYLGDPVPLNGTDSSMFDFGNDFLYGGDLWNPKKPVATRCGCVGEPGFMADTVSCCGPDSGYVTVGAKCSSGFVIERGTDNIAGSIGCKNGLPDLDSVYCKDGEFILKYAYKKGSDGGCEDGFSEESGEFCIKESGYGDTIDDIPSVVCSDAGVCGDEGDSNNNVSDSNEELPVADSEADASGDSCKLDASQECDPCYVPPAQVECSLCLYRDYKDTKSGPIKDNCGWLDCGLFENRNLWCKKDANGQCRNQFEFDCTVGPAIGYGEFLGYKKGERIVWADLYDHATDYFSGRHCDIINLQLDDHSSQYYIREIDEVGKFIKSLVKTGAKKINISHIGCEVLGNIDLTEEESQKIRQWMVDEGYCDTEVVVGGYGNATPEYYWGGTIDARAAGRLVINPRLPKDSGDVRDRHSFYCEIRYDGQSTDRPTVELPPCSEGGESCQIGALWYSSDPAHCLDNNGNVVDYCCYANKTNRYYGYWTPVDAGQSSCNCKDDEDCSIYDRGNIGRCIGGSHNHPRTTTLRICDGNKWNEIPKCSLALLGRDCPVGTTVACSSDNLKAELYRCDSGYWGFGKWVKVTELPIDKQSKVHARELLTSQAAQ